ncbi:MAG: TolC family protein [Bacteroidota bacterium]
MIEKVRLENYLIKYGCILLIVIGSYQVGLSQNLTLDSCIAMAEHNYPLINQYGLLAESKEYTVENVGKGKLPRFIVAGQASYQSAVTSLPGGAGPVLSKDQYKLYGEIIQPLTDLVLIEKRRQLTELNNEIEEKSLDVEFYQVQQRVSEIYFSIILLDRQLFQIAKALENLRSGYEVLETGVKNGTVLKSSANTLNVEILTLQQKAIEVDAARAGFLQMLGRFIGKEVESASQLKAPRINSISNDISRPELALFNAQIRSVQLQSSIVNTDNLPKFSLFFQGGVGRPALNFLSNDFQLYYIGGLRLSWNVSNLYTSKKQKDVFMLNENMIENRKEIFLFNTQLSLDNQSNQIRKAEQLIEKDEEIIALRESIRETANEQLKNGVIKANDFNEAVINESLARQNLELHRVELMQAKKQYQLTTGNFN